MKSKAPPGYRWPEVTDLWFAGVTAIIFLILEKIIEELAKLDPLTEQIFKQDTQTCLQALSLFLADLETDD